MSADQPQARTGRRRLPIVALLALIPIFILLPQLVSLFTFGVDAFEDPYSAVSSAVATEIVPDMGGALIAVGVIAWLGWGGLVRRERLRTRRWVWAVPIIWMVACIALVDYGQLSEAGPSLLAALAVGTFATGLSEELMFRGIALQALRDTFRREVVAATLTAVLFGATHLINILVEGAAAIPQSLLATALGYLLYLARRVSGGIVLPIVMHWTWDFSTYSVFLGQPGLEIDERGFTFFLLAVGLAIVALVGGRRISVRRPAEVTREAASA